MGGLQAGRRHELRQDIDSYISKVRRRKPFEVARRQSSWSIWPVFQKKEENLLSPITPQTPKIARPTRIKPQRPRQDFLIGPSAWWDSVKTSMRDTVRHDLESMNNQTAGGTKMKADDDFIDFEEGGLKVVPIPEEVELVKKPQSIPQESVMLDPFADDPIPKKEIEKPKKKGLLSKWFSGKKAAKEEAKHDIEFATKAVPVAVAPPPEDLELKEDFKELSKMFLKMLEKMNKEQLNTFKATDEFDRFKRLLQKHRVIK